MDFHPKQWRNQQYESEEEEQNNSAKKPKLINTNQNNPNETRFKKPELPSGSGLPLFVHQNHHLYNSDRIATHLSPPPPPTTTSTTVPSSRLSGMGRSYFSVGQWQELELQALIFRYILAGATVPVELLSPIKKSLSTLLNTPHYFLHQYYPHYQPAALFESGYWGRATVDPEPGRCRRTDGKKWRCSRDVVVGQKYCERHMHRGRHRSRKPVETPTPAGHGGGPPSATTSGVGGGGTHFGVPGKISAASDSSTSIDLLRLGRSSSDVTRDIKQISESNIDDASGGKKSEGHVLRHFFDDWPRSHLKPDNVVTDGDNNTTSLSISISMPGNSTSDVSLKLSTGDGDGAGHSTAQPNQPERQLGWASGWGSGSMGGPLAEALRSSNSNSPTSVLHQLQRGSAAETCIVGS